MNIVKKGKDGSISHLVSIKNSNGNICVDVNRQHAFTIYPSTESTVHLSTTYPDKNGRVILVGDKLDVQDDCPLATVFTDGTHFWFAQDDEMGDMLTPELAATMEVLG